MAISNKAINFVQGNLERGQAIPGQSLTNSPDEKYSWEKPAEFTNPRETMLYVFDKNIPKEMTGDSAVKVLQEGVNELDKIRNQAIERVNPQSVPSDVREVIEQTKLEPSLLEKIENEKPTSLLGKGEE